jgi:hypothetical protein
LDPEKKFNPNKKEIHAQRFCETEDMQELLTEELTTDLLVKMAPRSFSFYPTEPVMEKLLIRIN